MKVCHCITGLGVGGAENMLRQVVPELNDGEHDHCIVSLTDEDTMGKEIERAGVDVYYLGLRFDLLNLPAVIYRFGKLIRALRPDLLYCYLIHTNLFGRVFGRLFGVDTVVCSIRNKHIDKHFLNWLDRQTSGLVDLYIPNSEATVPFLTEHQGIPEEKIRVIPNGIDVDKFDITVDTEAKRDELQVDHDSFLLGCVAKLRLQKDHKTLFKAFKQFRNNKKTDLLLIGDGPMHDKLKTLTHELNLTDDVHFLGWRDDVPQLLHTIDVFVLPSRHEGMSNALLEAMACGCCCVASDIDENEVLLTDGENGRTFPTGDASALNTVLDDVYQRCDYGDAAVHTVTKHFSLQATIDKYEEVINECAAL